MTEPVVLFLLPGLGCSARTWDHVVDELAGGPGGELECIALDLPGHGDDAASDELTVEQMATHVIARLLERRAPRWALAGHSMGGKIATIVTARAERGLPGLTPPLGLVLVASSPLSPEPMDDATRTDMIGWCSDGPVSAGDAGTFIDANTASTLPDERRKPAAADVQRVSREAWLAWLERGSREDWSDTGVVRTPTLVVAGAEDGPLGADGQRRLVLPHVTAADVTEVAGAAHLIMLEQPQQLARLIASHLGTLAAARESLDPAFARLLDSDRVSSRTRQALLDRLPEPEAGVLGADRRALLAALLARVVPQRGTDIDLAGRLDTSLAGGAGDGWRFAELPPDAEAWSRGLDTLAAVAGEFADAGGAEQDRWIERLVAGEIGSDEPGLLTAAQMTLWFEDVRAEAIRTWLSHPAALARIGYDGFANGGDGVRKQGYVRVAASERERWQLPLPIVGRAT